MSQISVRLIRMALGVGSIFSFALAGFFASVTYFPVAAPYKPPTPMSEDAYVIGDTLFVARKYAVGSMQVNDKVYEGARPRLEGVSAVTNVSADEVIQTRSIPIGHLPTGQYQFKTSLCWKVNFLRSDCKELQLVNFSIDRKLNSEGEKDERAK